MSEGEKSRLQEEEKSNLKKKEAQKKGEAEGEEKKSIHRLPDFVLRRALSDRIIISPDAPVNQCSEGPNDLRADI